MAVTRPPKGHYTEQEVAQSLGIQVDELRQLVRKHILTDDEGLSNLPITSFLPADLLLLRMIVSQGGDLLTLGSQVAAESEPVTPEPQDTENPR